MTTNSKRNQPVQSQIDELWEKQFRSEWDRRVSSDFRQFDAELIAAYAEGNLTEEERTLAVQLLATSPAALDMLVTLREQLADSHRPLSDNGWRQLFDEKWTEEILSDQQAFDPDLIAIYADGNATAEERRLAEHLLATSPAALDMLVTLRQQSFDGDSGAHLTIGAAPAAESMTSAGRPALDAPPPLPGSRSVLAGVQSAGRADAVRRVRAASWIAAASMLLAIGAATFGLRQESENGQLALKLAVADRQLVSQAMALAISQQERIVETSASSIPAYAAGTRSVAFLKSVIADRSGTSRGMDDSDPPEIRAAKQATLLSASTVLDRWRSTSEEPVPAGVLVAQASLEISLNQLELAAETIRRIAAQLGETAPEVRNLQAMRMLAVAETQPMSEATATFAAARTLLESLVRENPEFADGWLNLALYLQRSVGPDNPATRSAWEQYLAAEGREDLKEVIRSRLSE